MTYKGNSSVICYSFIFDSLQIGPEVNDGSVFIYGDLKIRKQNAFRNCVEDILKICNFCRRHVYGKYRNVKKRKYITYLIKLNTKIAG
jgi:hypothetical protein